MGELLVVVSEENDIVYKQMYKKLNDEEYCRLVILAYGAIDTLIEMLMSTRSNYFDCLDEYGDKRASAYVMPSGYKILFVHNRKNVKAFLNDMHCLFTATLLAQPLEDRILEDQGLDDAANDIYNGYFGD